MAGQMWFGNRERMGWVPCPAIEADISKVGWSSSGRYLNGGGWVRRSTTAGKVYQFAWNLMPKAELRKFTDYADGVYGPGPYHFIDPFASDNILPSYWATPRLAAVDGPPLIKDKRPGLVPAAYRTASGEYVHMGSEPTDPAHGDLWWDGAGVPRRWSAPLGPGPRTNLLPNPSFEDGTTGYYSGSATITTTSAANSAIKAGQRALSITVEGANASNGYAGVATDLPPGSAGKWVGWSVVARRSTGVESARMWVDFPDVPDSSAYPHGWDLTAAPQAEQERQTVAFQVPEGATQVRTWLRLSASPTASVAPTDGRVHTDAWMLTIADTEAEALAAVASPYMDGDTAPPVTAWDGTPHASPSTYTPGWVEVTNEELTPTTPKHGYPSKSAVYTVSSEDLFSEIWLPVPEGQTLHFGAHGFSGGGTVVTLKEDGKTAREAPLMGLGNDLTNTQVQGPTGVTVSLGRKTYEWEGVPHASPSVERVNGVETRRNLVPDPRATHLWGPATHETTGGPSGVSTWAKYTHPDGPTNIFLSTVMNSAQVQDYAPVVPGETYTITASVLYSVMPEHRAQPYVQWYRADGTDITSDVPSGLVPGAAGEWHETVSVVTAPPGAAWARVGMSVGRITGPPGTYIGASRWLMTDSGGAAVASAYFDGDTPDDPTLTLNSMVAALVPNGEPAPTGEFPSGQGHSGVDFEDHPMVTGYSAGLDLVGATATLIETGAWL